MPIRDCPFTLWGNGIYRPSLPINIINSHDPSKSYKTWGLIDTGADECAIPSAIASILGHNLTLGTRKSISTGNGIATAYSHSTQIEIYHPVTLDVTHVINNTPVDFMNNLSVVLLGVNSFLSHFVLNIDYPQKLFSITKP
jgi:predicted aspartyl protease